MNAAPASFYRRTADALADARLRGAVGRVTASVRRSRQAALDRLPDADAWRDHARQLRAHTIAHLDRYLDEFAAAIEARGGHVFYAPTAEDAIAYVTSLVRSRNLKTAVKSKSMISEEIDLNARLEAAGVRVVETDLGEYVVQLADDHPSHIVMPIIHKTRGEIADLFRAKAGATDADLTDVASMTQFARRTLRPEFLRADLGVSGVNFGVASTGTLCVCTNEGNGRLVTTLPRVHVAMMGIERLVPTPEDLTVMLQILGRSATGQNLTVYTNLINGPRPADETDGPSELHVVLVDNGRSRVLGSELAEILYCIRCGACLNACPVYQEIGGHAYGSVYPGPFGSVLTPALRGLETFHDLPHASSLCGACREACPVRIDIPRMLLALRADDAKAHHAPWWIATGLRVYRWVATSPRRFQTAGRLTAKLMRTTSRDGWIRWLPPPLSGWTSTRDFPVMAVESFQERWARRTKPPEQNPS